MMNRIIGLDMLCTPPPRIEVDPIPLHDVHDRLELALNKSFRWIGRTVLHIKFLDGDPVVHQLIASIMSGDSGWNSACGLQCVFGETDVNPDIRISFMPGSSWSYVGSQAASIPLSQPTMNYGWLDRVTAYEEVRRACLHEFGHALGFVHEHNSPLANIPWDIDKVYAHYFATNRWDEAMVNSQVLAKYDADTVEQDNYDPHSIMHYLIPPFLLTDPSAVLGGNTLLSDQDRAKAQDWYGLPPARWRNTPLGTIVNNHVLG